ncbi:hypothetical protein JOF48_002894 [Arthrobacter stackebrandtii]|uniref:Uncharacterized protein n=1 Tax=Arthrobacter stackebrandtii TaxID=272161 RepID=A0ABS4Z044_9MICC|nr:hypothetical protein [Arthrobacter stackebrandtii]MBP2414095.1 hypothetical protein [Arthrobacter stackebrandtii]
MIIPVYVSDWQTGNGDIERIVVGMAFSHVLLVHTDTREPGTGYGSFGRDTTAAAIAFHGITGREEAELARLEAFVREDGGSFFAYAPLSGTVLDPSSTPLPDPYADPESEPENRARAPNAAYAHHYCRTMRIGKHTLAVRTIRAPKWRSSSTGALLTGRPCAYAKSDWDMRNVDPKPGAYAKELCLCACCHPTLAHTQSRPAKGGPNAQR